MTDLLNEWVDAHRTDPTIAYLIEHHTVTLAELADIGNVTIDRIAAYMGGLHDYGIVTKRGDKPWSTVRWDFDMKKHWASLKTENA